MPKVVNALEVGLLPSVQLDGFDASDHLRDELHTCVGAEHYVGPEAEHDFADYRIGGDEDYGNTEAGLGVREEGQTWDRGGGEGEGIYDGVGVEKWIQREEVEERRSILDGDWTKMVRDGGVMKRRGVVKGKMG